jgi:hypothetical protein
VIPIQQEVSGHDPERGFFGDCLRAALASLLELPLSDVPHFAAQTWPDTAKFQKNVGEWLATRGFVLIPTTWFDFKLNHFASTGDCYHLILGMCDDGFGGLVGHAVVGLNGVVVHDPNPEKPVMVDEIKDRYFGFLVHAG